MDTATLLLTLLLLFPAAPVAQEAGPPSAVAPDAATLRAHVAELASDEMAGRAAGSLGELAAAKYIVNAFEEAGLQPGAEHGWLQDTGVRGHDLHAMRVVLHGDDGDLVLEHGVDYSVMGLARLEGTYEIVVAESADDVPAQPSPRKALLLAGPDVRSSWLLAARLPEGGAGWGCLLLGRDSSEGEARPLPTHVTLSDDGPARIWLRGGALEAARAGRSARLEVALDLGEGRAANNVIGLLPAAEGSPHADEWVVVSAHYDHIGTRPVDPLEPEADRVYNGANDDAAGVAVMLAWARALAADRQPPARNLLFVAFTAEELGLVGSKHFAEHPPVPLERMVAMVNLEMLGEPDPALGAPGRMFLTGYTLSDLGPRWAAEGLPVAPDPRPDLNLFQRSDNHPLAERGVIAHTLSSGGENEHYHGLGDELDTLDFAHMEACARAGLEALRMLADGTLTPQWRTPAEGDGADGDGAEGDDSDEHGDHAAEADAEHGAAAGADGR